MIYLDLPIHRNETVHQIFRSEVSHGARRFRSVRPHPRPPSVSLPPFGCRPTPNTIGRPPPRGHRLSKLTCRAESKPVEPSPVESSRAEENTSGTDTFKQSNQDGGVSQNNDFPEFPNQDINRCIALTSTAAAVGLYLSRKLDFGVSLKDLAAASTPLEEVRKTT